MNKFNISYVLFFLFVVQTFYAQTISKPRFEPKIDRACAGGNFNSYTVAFSVIGISVENEFIIVLSDGTGDFTSSTEIVPSEQINPTSESVKLTFSFPTSTSGEAYRIKIKSTNPDISSSRSDAFPAYYKRHDVPFTINNLISTGVYCLGGSYVLSIDNPGDSENNSPLQYPSLTFNWFRQISETIFDFISEGETLAVSQPGVYFAETNYGTCTSNSFSNRVTITESGSGGDPAEISSSLGNPYCSSEGNTNLSAISGESYQWFKDGDLIPDATEQIYVTNESGVYSVSINLGGCSLSASIDLETSGFDSSIDVPELNMINDDDTLIATVTTDALSPEFEWYFNDEIISGATTNSYEATQQGQYRVLITETSDCQSTVEYSFAIQEAFPPVENIPNLVSPNGDGINDTWIIPQEYVSGTNTEITILSSQGEVVLKTNDYLNNWPENNIEYNAINPIFYYIITTENNQLQKGSITVVR